MSIFSNIQRANKVPAAGAPFPAGSADNGLMVDTVTGRIVLGQSIGAVGNPAALLDAREIPVSPFSLALTDLASNPFVKIDFPQTEISLGDYNGIVPGNAMLYLHWASGYSGLGDPFNFVNGNFLEIDDAGETFRYFQGGGLTTPVLEFDPGNAQCFLSVAPNDRMIIANIGGARVYQFGDIDTAANGARLNIDSINETIGLQSSAVSYVYVDGVAQTTKIGAGDSQVLCDSVATIVTIGDTATSGNGFVLRINDGGRVAQIADTAGNYFVADKTNNEYAIGDLDGILNATIVKVVDNTGKVQIDTTNGMEVKGGIYNMDDTTLIRTQIALANGAAAQVGTLNNAPAAGNPTKWIAIDDNGTTRHIPAW